MENLIVVDTREKGHKKILEYFDEIGQDYVVSKLEAGDYMLFKDFSTIIDRKNSLLELVGNLCKTTEHERIKAEIQRAKNLGCDNFIFLIAENKIKNPLDIKKWSSRHTKVKGEQLLKIMITMKKKYNVRFIISPTKKMGENIIHLLTKK